MKIRFKTLLTLFLFSGIFGFSQSPNPPSPCEEDPNFNQFDFWVGDWDVYAGEQLVGTNTVNKILGNCVVMENWTGTGGSIGKSFNSYNQKTQKWTQTWVDNAGSTLVFVGELEKGNMMMKGQMEGKENTVLFTLSFYPDPKNGTVQQVWKSSKDNGESWNVVFDGLYVKKGTVPSDYR